MGVTPSSYIAPPGCDLLSLHVKNYAFCAFFWCVCEPLRAPVAIIAVESGICSQFSKPAWRLLGMELPQLSFLVILVTLDFCIPCKPNQAYKPNHAFHSCLLSFIPGDDKCLQCWSSLPSCSLEIFPCLGVSSPSLRVRGGI